MSFSSSHTQIQIATESVINKDQRSKNKECNRSISKDVGVSNLKIYDTRVS